MPADLMAEYEAPEAVAAPPKVSLADEFEAPDTKDQHAVINDAAEKARQLKLAFATTGTPEAQKKVISDFAGALKPHMGDEQLKSLQSDWEGLNQPLVNLPLAPNDVPDVPVSIGGTDIRLPILAGAYNGLAPVASSLTSPLNLATLGAFGALTKVAAGAGPAAKVAQNGLRLISAYFGAEMAKGAGEAAGAASVPEGKTAQEETKDIASATAQGIMAVFAANHAAKGTPATDQSAVSEFNSKLDKIPGGPTGEPTNADKITSPVTQIRVGPETETPRGQVAEGVASEPVAPAGTGEIVKEEAKVTPAVEPPKVDLAEEFTPPPAGSEEHAAITEELAKQPEPPVEEPPAEEPSKPLAEQVTHPAEGPTGIRNAIVDEERKSRGLPPAMEEAANDFGSVWKDVSDKLNEDPEAAAKLVKEINENPRATTDLESGLLLHRQIDLQNQFDKVSDRVVNGSEGQTPESLATDRIELARLSDDLLDTYNADKASGRETGRGLNARKMLANEDYSLAKMVTVRRAANEGRPLTQEQTAEVQALHDKIAETQKRLAAYEAADKANKGQRAIRKVVVTYIGERANEARARIKARLEKNLTLGLTEGEKVSGLLSQENLVDLGTVGADYLARGVDAFATWSEKMVSEFGDRVKPHLEAIFKKSQEIAEDAEVEQAFADKKKRLEARVKELTKKVEEGDTSAEPTAVKRPSVAEIEKLEQQRDALSGKLSDMRATETKVKELEDAIAEKERKIAEGDLSAKGQPVNRPSVEAVETLKQERDQLNRDLTEARKEEAKPTDEEVTQKRLEEMQSRIAEKKAALASGDLTPERGQLNRPLPKELEEAQQELDQLNRDLTEARKEEAKPTDEEVTQKRLEEMQSRIAEKKAALASGDLTPERGQLNRPLPKELEEAQQELDQLNEAIADSRPKPEPVVGKEKASPEEIRLKSAKTRTQNRIAEINRRLAANDLGPRPKPTPVTPDPELLRLRAEAERAKQEFQTAVIKDRLAGRSSLEKAQDTLVRWRRGFLLSGPVTLAKLTGAAILRMGITPIEELTGAALGKALPDVFEKAPRQGGFNSRAEAEAITSVWTKGIADAKKKLTTAKSDLDVLFGKGANVRESDVIPQSLIDFFGNLHGALKAPIMRSEFERSMVKRMDYAIRNGVDVSDPAIQTKIAIDAYKDSQRAIFMQDNVLSKAFNTMVASLQNSKVNGGRSAVGKGVATTLRLIMPIVKVPTNIVAEAAEYAVGSITGSAELASIYKKGIETLTEDQADRVARQLKKGSLGAAALLIGYFNRNNFGGFYQQGEKRGKDELNPGEAKIGGQTIGKSLIHAPLVETMQIGATVGRIMDEKVKGKNTPASDAIGEATLGLLEELPFVRTPIELGKLFDKRERPYAEGELVKGLVVPQALSQVATSLDTDAKGNPISRKPSTVLEHVKTGVPGLRETVRKR